ncbi:tRNA (uridine(54)-C5)-methyltransferase TrmA [Campylobacter majalis]|uniref:tRNA (uridine(54)-C5)-methyltransferase TrmA n=1 Tax=Campylobacter majalis TaxID=2790656 RepID=UPI003D682858
MPYDEQVKLKLDLVSENFGEFYDGGFEFFTSNSTHYRTRAEFGIWHDNDKISYTMNHAHGGKLCIDECLKVSDKIFTIMPKLLSKISENDNLKQRLFGVDFLQSSSEVLITLLYHKKLDESYLNDIRGLADALEVKILARSRKVKILSDELDLKDELNINGKKFELKLSETAFTQPNKAINEKMISWAGECVCDSDDLLELYCGHGNFTIPLSFKFNRVLATEISKSSIANAKQNCQINGVSNTKFLRMSADELMSAFNKEREFNRLKDIDIFDYNFTHVLVDPPRAGLSKSVIEFIKNYENIIYISCCMDSLKRDLKHLNKTHKVLKFGVFDQFANTHHVECGVLLKRFYDG